MNRLFTCEPDPRSVVSESKTQQIDIGGDFWLCHVLNVDPHDAGKTVVTDSNRVPVAVVDVGESGGPCDECALA